MQAEYDKAIAAHYDRVAAECGLSPQSTMADEIIRAEETAAISEYVADALREAQGRGGRGTPKPTLVDVGCGNGYTLKTLAGQFSGCTFVGIEHNRSLLELAREQLAGLDVSVRPGDLRARDSIDLADGSVDILVCQRVLINLLSLSDARRALDNIVALVRAGGALLFIESFSSGLAALNEARAEFALEPIGPAHHNRYLEDDFFAHPQLEPHPLIAQNRLSTHYYVTRVLHSALTQAQQQQGFKRNSHFVRFLSQALPPGIGDYAPLQFHGFVKRGQ